MKLLISAYACAPDHGSEHAVGWNWITQAHLQGHRVWALASTSNRTAIEAACRADPALHGISWVFPEISWWKLQPGKEPRFERSYNLLWQLAALRRARALQAADGFDVVHHLNWGGVRAPTFLGALGAPLVIGPIGGGETSPAGLRDGFHLKARLTEIVRDFSNATIRFNPLVRGGLSRAAAIFTKTPDTARLLSRSMRAKSAEFLEIGLRPEALGTARAAPAGPPRLLFIGRLIYWKGGHIAIRAFGELVERMPQARLTIVGKGPELGRLKGDVARMGLQASVEFMPWLPRKELVPVYDRHDIFLFPSLHDSSGGVVLEALSRGLPVICLDCGGPCHIIDRQSGIAVATAQRTTQQVSRAIADEIAGLCADPARLAALSEGAIARARAFLLPASIAQFYAQLAGRMGLPKVPAPKPVAFAGNRAKKWAAVEN